MANIGEFELVVDSTDTSGIDAVLAQVPGIETIRARPSRAVDPATVIGIVGGIVTLVNGLLELKGHLSRKKDEARVLVRDISGRTIDLATASPVEIRAFLEGQST